MKRIIGKINIRTILVFFFLLIGLILTLYPVISNYIYENRADGVISTVSSDIMMMSDYKKDTILKDAKEYNKTLAEMTLTLKDINLQEAGILSEYDNILNLSDDGVMGFIEIPKINISLPIYHGTSDEVLKKGIGHVKKTSFPVGGESTHSVLTGHTGLSTSKMFTDLTSMIKGDIFFISNFDQNEKMAYKVISVKVVLPNETDDLQIRKGKDLVTLYTCTPYGVNSHRLLVTGERTAYSDEVYRQASKNKSTSKWVEEYMKAFIPGILAAISLFVFLKIWETLHLRRKRKKGC